MTRPWLSVSVSRFALSLVALGAWSCASGSEEEAGAVPQLALNVAADQLPSLCCGTKTTLAEGITAAENLFISSDERLFVSGDDGVYELVREPDGSRSA